MYRQTTTGIIKQEFAFHSAIKLILENTDISEVYNEMVDEIEA